MTHITIPRSTIEQALNALDAFSWEQVDAARIALRAALAGPCPCGDRPADQCPGEWEPGCDLGNNPKYAKQAEPAPEPQCSPHPKAPHGFLRNASHTEDRYVCECEYWEPYEAGYQAGMAAALATGDNLSPTEPVALDWLHKWAHQDDGEPETQRHEGYEAARRVVQIHLTAPPQRLPLTEDEIRQIGDTYTDEVWRDDGWSIDFARAVERAHGIKE
jgi:hypothetical protein